MLDGRPFALAMTSPLIRASESCERAGLVITAEVTDDLLEWDYGTYEGVSTPDAREQIPDWSVWTHPIIGGETVESVGGRADSVIDRALSAPGDADLFAHGHLLRILAADAGRHLALNTATISTLGFERENRVIRRWNEGCHLRESKLPPDPHRANPFCSPNCRDGAAVW